MGSTVRRLAFALRFGEINLFTSGLITGESRILYVRDVRARVQLLAPFLDFDSDPYPVIIDGRLKWVIDAYTTTDQYPYAQRADTSALPPGSGLDHRFNYVRNSVKAVVDAYDGRRHLLYRRSAGPHRARLVQGVPEAVHRRRCPPSCRPTSAIRTTSSGFRPTPGAATTSPIRATSTSAATRGTWPRTRRRSRRAARPRRCRPSSAARLASTNGAAGAAVLHADGAAGHEHPAVRLAPVVRAVLRRRSAEDAVSVHDRIERSGRLREDARLRDVESVARRALARRLRR